jgi:hypothetical protein
MKEYGVSPVLKPPSKVGWWVREHSPDGTYRDIGRYPTAEEARRMAKTLNDREAAKGSISGP